MFVLVDYDNVESLDRRRGLMYLATRILDAVGSTNLAGETRAHFRLYGGWYEGDRLSRRAQQLGAEVAAAFPTVITIGGAGGRKPITVTVELATSLIVDPKTDFFNTYRKYGPGSNLLPRSRPWTGCHAPTGCPLGVVEAFFRSAACPTGGCTVTPQDALHRPEQKLVDTMLTVDILRLGSSARERMVVVSSDDDMWPGIKSALLMGARVIHVHTKAGRTTPPHYSRNAGTTYSEATF